MLASLDQFVFGLSTAAYTELQRRTSWKHRATSRVGGRDARQYTGQGDDAITLTGLVAPENKIGTLDALAELRTMADAGEAYVLVDGAGNVFGAFVIEGLDEAQSYHQKTGTPRRVEFTLNLMRVDDALIRSKTTVKKDTTSSQ